MITSLNEISEIIILNAAVNAAAYAAYVLYQKHKKRDLVPVEFRLAHPLAMMPTKKRSTDASYDCFSVEKVVIQPGKVSKVSLGIQVSVPEGWYYTMDGRSGKGAVGVVPFRGTIDATYGGTLFAVVYNHGDTPLTVQIGDRPVQMTFHRQYTADFLKVDEFSDTHKGRGDLGWGSSGN